jgi:aspartyl-tRNA(Asn)/glutamyl-tRNA(Gln) amidotransferase subunit A
VTVVEELRSGELAAAALTERYLERIGRLDGEVKAFVTVTGDLARAQAAAADEALARGGRPGPLHGLPVALKDNIDTAGIRTTRGSRFFADRVPAEDAEVARRLREAGAVLLGKLALHEFAYGATTQNPHHGECRNPWDTSRIPGGSSGGSGAALGADLCAAALGTDTGGSVRIPAALNGVSGLRPTFGRVSNRGVFPVSATFDTVGPMARSVVDVARLFVVLAGYDGADPTSVDMPLDDCLETLELGVDGLRIGLPAEFFFEEVDAEIVRGVRAAGDLLAALGAELVELDLPGAAEALEATTLMIRAEAFSVHRERLRDQPELFGEDVRRRLPLGEDLRAADYGQWRETGRVWRRTLDRAFERADAILTPVAGTVAPTADAEMIETTHRLTRLTYGWSLARLPALAIPGGFVGGLPFALQLAAPPRRESTLLRIGAAYQQETDWHLRRPPLPA